jgi:ABC-type dipeptide/oligopeptide/nickel transport system permease component
VTRFIVRRVGLMVIVFAGLVVVAFLLTHVLPGDPAQAAAGRNATAAQIAVVRVRLGLNDPLIVQFGRYVRGLLHGDLGTSVFTHDPVMSDIGQVLPSSIELVVAAMVINIVVAVPLGVLSAYRQGRLPDIAARLIVVLGAAVPVFWLALILQLVFADQLKILPLSGQLGFGYSVPHRTGIDTLDALLAGDMSAFFDAVDHLILPAVTLAAAFIAVITRTVRSSMLGVLEADYITLARATGASEWRVVIQHGLRNALLPTTTILGMQLGWMLGATVLVESTFNRTGIGAYMVTAVLQDDLYAVIGSILVIGVVFIVANFLVDLLQLWLNPRLRETGRSGASPGPGVGAGTSAPLELAS